MPSIHHLFPHLYFYLYTPCLWAYMQQRWTYIRVSVVQVEATHIGCTAVGQCDLVCRNCVTSPGGAVPADSVLSVNGNIALDLCHVDMQN